MRGDCKHKQQESPLQTKRQPVNLPSFSMLQQESVRFESGCLGYHKKKSDESNNPSQRGENDFRDGQRLNCSLRLFIGPHPSRRKIVTAVAANCVGWIDKLTNRTRNHGALGGFGELADGSSVLWVAGWRGEFLRTIGFVVARPRWFNYKHPSNAGYSSKGSPFNEQTAKINLDSASIISIRIGWRIKQQ